MTALGAPMSEADIVDLVEHATAEALRVIIEVDRDDITWYLPLPSWTRPGEKTVIETELRRRFPNWRIETHIVGSIEEFMNLPIEPATAIGGVGGCWEQSEHAVVGSKA